MQSCHVCHSSLLANEEESIYGHSLRTANFCINCPDSQAVTSPSAGDSVAMLTEIYIEALLVNDELADQVWEALVAGEIDDLSA